MAGLMNIPRNCVVRRRDIPAWFSVAPVDEFIHPPEIVQRLRQVALMESSAHIASAHVFLALYNKTPADILYICTVLVREVVKVIVTPMRRYGVEIPRRMLRDRSTVIYKGMLVIADVTDQGLRRPVKVARLHVTTRTKTVELVEPHIIWANDGKFVLAGFERVRNEAGELVDFAQSWLCEIDTRPTEAPEGDVRQAHGSAAPR
jgi:hypothetical protein